MHPELDRQGGALAGLEYHRTDGRSRGSTPLHNFDVRRFVESQDLISGIGEPEGYLDRLA